MDAKETLNQLTQSPNGMGVLAMMIGATKFAKTDDSVMFRFPAMKHSPRHNHVEIRLDGNDTYTLKLGRVVKNVLKAQKEVDGIYNDTLKDIFEKETGLFLKF